jgi:hypothetical protein
VLSSPIFHSRAHSKDFSFTSNGECAWLANL